MITIRKSIERGYFNFGWLETYHTFSFGNYRDPNHMNFSNLRVINEDTVKPNQGFGTHPHRNMEIITYVLKGELAHQDSMGNGFLIKAGDIQHMSAGKGVTHSEFNPSKHEAVHLLQLWLLPKKLDINPVYHQIHLSQEDKTGNLHLIASHQEQDGTVQINADARIFACVLPQERSIDFTPLKNHTYWLQVAQGSLHINGISLNIGDGASIKDEDQLDIRCIEETEFLLFELL